MAVLDNLFAFAFGLLFSPNNRGLGVLTLTSEGLVKLIELVAHLRGPDGCAWDRAQNYDSMKGLVLQEAYEVIDAINQRDFDGLEDELGDLFFQVVFYAQLADEERRFTLDDVIERLHAKLIRRHPHVFGETRARTPEEALASWLAVKDQEREVPSGATRSEPNKRPASVLDGIPETFPATLEAFELGVRAAEVGFNWVSIDDLLKKVTEEVAELRHELAQRIGEVTPLAGPGRSRPLAAECSGPQGGRLEEEIGDLLFAASNLARYLGSDPESCLRRANQKFKSRFQVLEREVNKLGKRVRDCTPEELDRLWNAAKQEARSNQGATSKEQGARSKR